MMARQDILQENQRPLTPSNLRGGACNHLIILNMTYHFYFRNEHRIRR